jgi:uncharacterized phiE125 gp8 family phage protein
MSDILAVGSRINAGALEFFDKATGRTLATFNAAVAPIHAAYFTATQAQLNAGFVIAADDANKQYVCVGFFLKITGTLAALTDIRLSDSSNVDIVTVVQTSLTDGSVFTENGGTGVTIGAGFAAALTAGKGLVLRKTGSAGTGGTSITGVLLLKHIGRRWLDYLIRTNLFEREAHHVHVDLGCLWQCQRHPHAELLRWPGAGLRHRPGRRRQRTHGVHAPDPGRQRRGRARSGGHGPQHVGTRNAEGTSGCGRVQYPDAGNRQRRRHETRHGLPLHTLMDFSGLTLVTAPTATPVSVADVKAHSRLGSDPTIDDSLLTGYIRAATSSCENRTTPRRAFMPQTWRLALSHFPGRGTGHSGELDNYQRWNHISIPKPPLVSIVSFSYIDTNGNAFAMTQGYGSAVGNYLLDLEPEPGRIVLPFSGIWPTTILLPGSPILITFNCGYPAYSGVISIDVNGVATWVSGSTFDARLAGTWLTAGIAAPFQSGSFAVAAVIDATHMQLVVQDPPPITLPTVTSATWTGNAVPMPFRQGVLYLTAHMYENREPVVTGRGITSVEVSNTLDAILATGE